MAPERPAGGNLDPETVAGFGAEWGHYDQSSLPEAEARRWFEAYFRVFPHGRLNRRARGLDAGCGSGRWARFVAPRVGELILADASAEALAVARRNLAGHDNCRFLNASLDALPIPDRSLDFAYSLGVLHHLPDPAAGLGALVRKLKVGAPLLVYLYYAFDDRPWWFRALWRASDVARRGISRLPFPARLAASRLIAAGVYWPLARTAAWLERRGVAVDGLPLAAYRQASFYTMRTDALDRFGTRLEHRFTRAQLTAMMSAAGLVDIRFSPQPPYWCAVGYRGAGNDSPPVSEKAKG